MAFFFLGVRIGVASGDRGIWVVFNEMECEVVQGERRRIKR